jgi:cell division transport system permease protein
MRIQFLFSELAIGLRRNITMTLAAIVTITISATLLGGALMLRDGAASLQHEVFNQIEVSVYMQDACGSPDASPTNCLTQAEQQSIYNTLHQLPQVSKITYLSPADAYKLFKEDYAGNQSLINSANAHSLPSSYEVKLKDPHDFDVIQSAVGHAPGVQHVTDARKDLQTLFTFFRKIELGVLLIAIVLLAASLMLIYNTMLVAAFTRRRETGIMRLVGASDFSIQAPFILEGTVIGGIGSVLAVGMLALARWFISSATSNAQLLRPFGSVGTYAHALPLVVAVGVLLPAIASFVTLQRHLRV